MNKKDELIRTYEGIRAALRNCDQEALKALILDDYKGFSLNGTIDTKEIILQHFKPGGVVITKDEVEDLEVEVFESIGLVSGKGRIEGKYGEFSFKHHVLFIDIFRYIRDEWKYYKSQVTEIVPD